MSLQLLLILVMLMIQLRLMLPQHPQIHILLIPHPWRNLVLDDTFVGQDAVDKFDIGVVPSDSVGAADTFDKFDVTTTAAMMPVPPMQLTN